MIKRMISMAMFGLLALNAGNALAAAGDTISQNTGLTVIADGGKTYNIDSLLNQNKVLVIYQTFAG